MRKADISISKPFDVVLDRLHEVREITPDMQSAERNGILRQCLLVVHPNQFKDSFIDMISERLMKIASARAFLVYKKHFEGDVEQIRKEAGGCVNEEVQGRDLSIHGNFLGGMVSVSTENVILFTRKSCRFERPSKRWLSQHSIIVRGPIMQTSKQKYISYSLASSFPNMSRRSARSAFSIQVRHTKRIQFPHNWAVNDE
jgi:hypothetical protein